MNRHGKMKWTYKNDHEDTDDHHRHIAGTLHGLAGHCHAAIYRHHHRGRIALFVPKSATVSSGAPIRWDNPTATEHTITHLSCLENGNALRIRFPGSSCPIAVLHFQGWLQGTTFISAASIPSCTESLSSQTLPSCPHRHNLAPSNSMQTGPCESPSPSCRLRRSTLPCSS